MYFIHGACASDKRLYNTWKTMIHRCENPKRESYERYGGRGITVCNEWHDPNRFLDWAVDNGYKPGLQIDRIDNNGPYSPDNCRWATPKENSRNRRNTKELTVGGDTKCVSAWAELLSISPYTIHCWYKKSREYAENRIAEVIANGAVA